MTGGAATGRLNRQEIVSRPLPEVLRMASHGDWQTRALALSAAGRIARDEGVLARAWGLVLRRSSSWRRRFPTAAARGRHVRNRITDGLHDRSWPVRTAAALALGECRASSPARTANLRRLLKGSFRAERLAAAAAILHAGGTLPGDARALFNGAAAAPPTIGASTRSTEFLASLASAHHDVLRAWLRAGADRPASDTPRDWAIFMAGAAEASTYGGAAAEIHRYDADADAEYLLTKPFSDVNRAQNVRLLHSFLVAAEHLHVPAGGRILDLGGGSGWVSELLATLGYRPTTLDLSVGLLNVAARRFARSGRTLSAVAGDMTRLPVASGSMDAVIVMDALHHVPDVPAVFREAARVLVKGGAFILAEPGDGHAEAEKSRGEMIEHGVLESEIHVFEAVGFAREAGFDDIRIVPHYVPAIAMSPSQLEAAMVTPAEEWKILQGDRPGDWSTYVLQSIFNRPILVFRKGRRVVDSLAPGMLRADVQVRLIRQGQRARGTVTVRNTGDTIWIGGGDALGCVRVGVQLLDADRRLLDREFDRRPLPKHLGPGQTADVPLEVTLPDAGTPYVLKIDLVDEGICWFEDAGSTPAYFRLAP